VTREQIIAIAEEVKANNDMFGDFSVALYALAFEAGRVAEREECIEIVESYKVSVGNSRAGELACEWTIENLREIRDAIRARSLK
jgi:hypothetical protein